MGQVLSHSREFPSVCKNVGMTLMSLQVWGLCCAGLNHLPSPRRSCLWPEIQRSSEGTGCYPSPIRAMGGQAGFSGTVVPNGKGSEARDRMSPGWPCAWPCHRSGPATCCSVVEFSPGRSVNPRDIHYWGWPQLVRDPVTPPIQFQKQYQA